jgi:tetratricopeptide (TPR) repeat protein
MTTTRVLVLAQVPAEAACLPTTLPSLRRLGEVLLVNAGAGPEVSAAARDLAVPVEEMEWLPDRSAMFNAVLSRQADQNRVLAYADETVHETGHTNWSDQSGVSRVGIRHITGPDQAYVEEHEGRCLAAGDMPDFVGLRTPVPNPERYPEVRSLPDSGIVFVHYPSRWPDLAHQRTERTAQTFQHAVDGEPADPDALFGLLRAACSLKDWARAARAADGWRRHARRDDGRRPIADYYTARVQVAQGDVGAACGALRDAVAGAPRFADAWYLLGELHAVHQEAAEAETAFRRAAAIGFDAEPLVVEDHSLATWRPLQALATLARKDGRTGEADALLNEARAVRDQVRQQMNEALAG